MGKKKAKTPTLEMTLEGFISYAKGLKPNLDSVIKSDLDNSPFARGLVDPSTEMRKMVKTMRAKLLMELK